MVRLPEHVRPTALNGYWLYCKSNVILEFPGASNEKILVSGQLTEGWNLFGSVSEIDAPYNDNINGVIWFWEDNLFKVVPREDGVLEPGKAYWINSRIPQVYP